MKRQKTVHARLLAGVSVCVLTSALATLAQAQEAVQDSAVSEVVVTGYRSSLAKALSIKRENTAAVDSIIAEDIAKFPDNNLAESIQRIPGVSISRDQGEGRSLSVRGLGPDFTRVRINGMEAQAATDGIAGGVNRGRGFDFNIFASELFSRIDVRKTASADVEEGSLGATVDLMTGHPFDYNGRKFAASAQANYNDQSKKANPRLAFLASDTWADGKFGALFSIAYSRSALDFQQTNSGNWNQGSGDGGWCRPTTSVAGTGLCDVPAGDLARYTTLYNTASSPTVYGPRFPRYVHSIGETERTGLTGSLQWRPQEGTTVSLDVLFSRFKTDRDDYNLEAIGLSRGASQGGKPETLVKDLIVDDQNSIVYALLDNVDMRSEHNQDDFSTDFGQWSLKAEHEFSDRLSGDAAIGYSYSDFDNSNDIATHIDRFNVDNYAFDLRKAGPYRPAINYGFDVNDAANWYFGPTVLQPGGAGPTGPEIRLRPNYTDNNFKTAAVNLKYALNDEITLRAGATHKQYEFIAQSYRFVGSEANWPAIPAGSSIQSLTQSFCGLEKISAPSPTPTCWIVPNVAAMTGAYNIYGNTGRTELSTTVASARGDNKRVTEKDDAGYVMADFNHDFGWARVRGDLGVRYVRTKQASSFYTNVPTTVNPSGFVWTTVERSYTDTLPSLNLVVEPREDFLIRFGAAKVMSRPQLGNLAAATSVSVSGGSRTVTTGNPELDPFRAKTLDLSFEWYPSQGAILSAAFFYKKINTYIQNVTTIAPYASTGLPDNLIANTGASASDDFSISRVINTPGGPLKGVELNFQQPLSFLPEPFDGFGVLLNYTYVTSEIDYFTSTAVGARTVKADLLNLSNNAYNATLYYEKGPYQARVSANYRGSYLRAVPGAFNMDAAGAPAATYVDFSSSYKVNDQLSVSFEALNMTNEKSITWQDTTAQRFEDYRIGGRQYYVGLRYNF
jgi:TonB-dependent receptor